MEESVNPFLEGSKELEKIVDQINEYGSQIEYIKRDLERKQKMLIESRINHKSALEAMANKIKASCTHKLENGDLAVSLTHKDILVPSSDNSEYIRYSFCELCGAKFMAAKVKIDKPKNVGNSYIATDEFLREYGASFDDDHDTLQFDPNFNVQNFLTQTETYFGHNGDTTFI